MFTGPRNSQYNRDTELYDRLINELYYGRYPDGVTLPPEYADFVQNNLLRLLIRLARYKFVARMLRPRDHLLEIGSGSGVGTMFLSQHCARATGIDVKLHEVEEARGISKRDNVDFEVADFFTYPAERKFDAIAALDVIEHMPIEVGAQLIAKASTHLNPGGMLIIGTPSVYVREYQSALSKASHIKMYDQDELVELVERSFHRVLPFSMNDEMMHTGMPKMSWYYFVLAVEPHTAAAP